MRKLLSCYSSTTGAAAGVAVTTIGGAVGGGLGYTTTQLIDGDPINQRDFWENAAVNGALANLPWKMVGYRGFGNSS